jgi:hypothetical protein
MFPPLTEYFIRYQPMKRTAGGPPHKHTAGAESRAFLSKSPWPRHHDIIARALR